jgi:hypothetical protein
VAALEGGFFAMYGAQDIATTLTSVTIYTATAISNGGAFCF